MISYCFNEFFFALLRSRFVLQFLVFFILFLAKPMGAVSVFMTGISQLPTRSSPYRVIAWFGAIAFLLLCSCSAGEWIRASLRLLVKAGVVFDVRSPMTSLRVPRRVLDDPEAVLRRLRPDSFTNFPQRYLVLLRMIFKEFWTIQEPFLRLLRLDPFTNFPQRYLVIFWLPSSWWASGASCLALSSAVDEELYRLYESVRQCYWV